MCCTRNDDKTHQTTGSLQDELKQHISGQIQFEVHENAQYICDMSPSDYLGIFFSGGRQESTCDIHRFVARPAAHVHVAGGASEENVCLCPCRKCFQSSSRVFRLEKLKTFSLFQPSVCSEDGPNQGQPQQGAPRGVDGDVSRV